MIVTTETPDVSKYYITRWVPGKGLEVVGCVKYFDTEGELFIRLVNKDGKWVEVAESTKGCRLQVGSSYFA